MPDSPQSSYWPLSSPPFTQISNQPVASQTNLPHTFSNALKALPFALPSSPVKDGSSSIGVIHARPAPRKNLPKKDTNQDDFARKDSGFS